MLFEFFKNFKNKSNSKTRTLALDRPSGSKRFEDIVYGTKIKRTDKFRDFLSMYPGCNLDSTKLTNKGENLSLTMSNEVLLFNYFRVGEYDIQSKIWTWDWSEEEGFNNRSPMVEVRNYGYNNYHEILTKSRWIGSMKDVLEVVYISLAIKEGLIDVRINTLETCEYYILMDNIR